MLCNLVIVLVHFSLQLLYSTLRYPNPWTLATFCIGTYTLYNLFTYWYSARFCQGNARRRTFFQVKKEAREILADDGKPKEEITIKLPDIPIIRKGDKIHLKTASISAGYYIVISAMHDVDKMLMTLGLKKAPAAKKSSGNKKTKAKSYDVGDIVNFHGGKHYVSSYPDARGYSVGAGKAKITIKGGSGKAHPWHLVTQNWNQTHVWGWVDDGSFD